MWSLDDPLIIIIQALGAIVGWGLLVIVARWLKDYFHPAWRQIRWNEDKNPIVHYLPKWQSWYAWRPVKTVQGETKWLETIYRTPGNTYVDYDDWRWYHYGTIMDVLKDPE